MSDNHGNTPAAWTAVIVALVGFVVGGVGLMLSPISMVFLGRRRDRGRPRCPCSWRWPSSAHHEPGH